MVVVAQLVRAPDCGSGGRRFGPIYPTRGGDLPFLWVHQLRLEKNRNIIPIILINILYEFLVPFSTYFPFFLEDYHFFKDCSDIHQLCLIG